MRRLKLVFGVAALMVAIMAASAAPAAAQTTFLSTGDGDGFFDDEDDCFSFDGTFICDGFDDGFFDDEEECFFFDDEECFFFDEEECFFFDDEECFFDGDGDNDFVDFADGIDQDVEQEAESGDVDQSFDISQTGNNSNQTVSTQGVANTGNAQNIIDVLQVGGDADDFDFDDVGSSITVSPSFTTDSVQRVDNPLPPRTREGAGCKRGSRVKARVGA
jgi:hypothetical protein